MRGNHKQLLRNKKTYVHDTTVNVAKFLEAKKPRAVCRVIEDVTLHQLISTVSSR